MVDPLSKTELDDFDADICYKYLQDKRALSSTMHIVFQAYKALELENHKLRDKLKIIRSAAF